MRSGSAPPAGWWESTTRPTTASSARSTAGGLRRSTSAGAAGRGCRTGSAHLEQKVIAFCLAYPGYGPPRIAAELARPNGAACGSQSTASRVLRRFNLNTRAKRLALIARHADPFEERPPSPPPERHIEIPLSQFVLDEDASRMLCCPYRYGEHLDQPCSPPRKGLGIAVPPDGRGLAVKWLFPRISRHPPGPLYPSTGSPRLRSSRRRREALPVRRGPIVPATPTGRPCRRGPPVLREVVHR